MFLGISVIGLKYLYYLCIVDNKNQIIINGNYD